MSWVFATTPICIARNVRPFRRAQGGSSRSDLRELWRTFHVKARSVSPSDRCTSANGGHRVGRRADQRSDTVWTCAHGSAWDLARCRPEGELGAADVRVNRYADSPAADHDVSP